MGRSSPRFVWLAAVVLGFLMVAGAWIGRDRFRPLGPGARAPDFTYPDLSGRPVSLSDHRGKVVVVNIWATWCPPCRAEMPSMERVYRQLSDRGFEILAVSIDRPEGERDLTGNPGGNIGAFADSLGLTFPILHDVEGGIQRLYQTTGVPESFVIAADGTIHRKLFGAAEWDEGAIWELLDRLTGGDGGG